MRARHTLLIAGAALYFLALIGIAFVPGSGANRTLWVWPFAAFIPVGIFLALLLGPRRWWAAIGFSLLGAAWLEAAQSIWMPVGYAEAIDVLWATLGATVGITASILIVATGRKSMRAHESHRNVAQAERREIPQD
jgi:glycopeptide antibiotics resistance protein